MSSSIYSHWDDDIGVDKKYSSRSDWNNLFKSEKFALCFIENSVHSVLDVGCGTGELSEVFQNLSNNEISYTGIDVSKKTLGVAIEKYPCHKFIRENFLSLECKNESYDLVYSTGVVQHESRPFKLIDKCVSISKVLSIFDLKLIAKNKSVIDIDLSYSNYRSRTFYNLINICEVLEGILRLPNIKEVVIFGYKARPNEYVVLPDFINVNDIYAANLVVKKGTGTCVKIISIMPEGINTTLAKKIKSIDDNIDFEIFNC